MNKPVAVVITDTHMSDKNINLVKDIFRQTFEYCKENGITRIFHAGDWFTSRTGQSIACLMATRDIIAQAHMDYGLWITAIAGNHDKADQSICESFLSVFEGMPGFRLISKYGAFPIIKEKLVIDMLPYFSKEEYNDLLHELNAFTFEDPNGDTEAKHILITHAAINGVRNNDGTEVTEGHPTNVFAYFNSVLVGHYHNKSKINNNIYYIGSAYQANFGEDEQKGITVIYEDGSHEQIQLDFPRFIKFKVNVSELGSADILELKRMKESSNDNIRVILTGTVEEVESFNKALLEQAGISVEKKTDEIENMPMEEIETVSYNRENLGEAFKEFCLNKNIKNSEYGQKLLQGL